MATSAHCAYCFETLIASFEQRHALSLSKIEGLWDEFTGGKEDEEEESDADMADVDQDPPAKGPAVSRLLNVVSSSSSSSSLTSRSTATSSSSFSSSSPADAASSRTSVSSLPRRHVDPGEKHPLFITWNTVSRSSGQTSLRGCIGTFEPQPLSRGLSSYALTSAFEDSRFSPISASLLPQLQVCVTLLTNFSAPTKDPLAWEIGKHGIRISFGYHGRRFGATYLPDVAKEQGWTKEEALVSLMRKAGWTGKKDEWRRVSGLELVTYEGKKVSLGYGDFKAFREWLGKKGV